MKTDKIINQMELHQLIEFINQNCMLVFLFLFDRQEIIIKSWQAIMACSAKFVSVHKTNLLSELAELSVVNNFKNR
jgi:hypothetical protein